MYIYISIRCDDIDHYEDDDGDNKGGMTWFSFFFNFLKPFLQTKSYIENWYIRAHWIEAASTSEVG